MTESRPRTELLFSYGTLRQPEVQRATLGQEIPGSETHPVLVPAATPASEVAGTVCTLTNEHLAAADQATQLLLVHDIHGAGSHTDQLALRLHKATELEILTPDLFGYSDVDRQTYQDPYQRFTALVGCEVLAERVSRTVHAHTARGAETALVGLSVGATAVWLAARSGLATAAVCIYGSRIRDHLDVGPSCPTLVLLAEDEVSYEVGPVAKIMARHANVFVSLLPGRHGFCNPADPAFDANLRDTAIVLSADFLSRQMIP